MARHLDSIDYGMSEAMRATNRNIGRGFTLVELLIVILILSILMAIALPLYTHSVVDSSKKTCRANMQSIANAAQAWKVSGRKTDFTSLTAVSQLSGDIGSIPICPDGGSYQVVAGGVTVDNASGDLPESWQTAPLGMGVKCSLPQHGGYVPGQYINSN